MQWSVLPQQQEHGTSNNGDPPLSIPVAHEAVFRHIGSALQHIYAPGLLFLRPCRLSLIRRPFLGLD
jgi:hypothetical protein